MVLQSVIIGSIQCCNLDFFSLNIKFLKAFLIYSVVLIMLIIKIMLVAKSFSIKQSYSLPFPIVEHVHSL